MKLTSDKILYMVLVSGIVAYMLLNHGDATTAPPQVEDEIDVAIREGGAEERSSDDGSDLSPTLVNNYIANL